MQDDAPTDTLDPTGFVFPPPASPSSPLSSVREDTYMSSQLKLPNAVKMAPVEPPLPDLEKFRDNLIKAMVAKRMTASDVARAVWGSKKNTRGISVARNRDRMTHYLAGKSYPRPETVLKLAEVLDLDPADLEREYQKANAPSPVPGSRPYRDPGFVPAPPGKFDPVAAERGEFEFAVQRSGKVLLHFRKLVDMQLAMRLFDAIRATDPDFNAGEPLPGEEPPKE